MNSVWRKGDKIICVFEYAGRNIGDIKTLVQELPNGSWLYEECDGLIVAVSNKRNWAKLPINNENMVDLV